MAKELRIYWRWRLPHWRIDDATYFVTWRMKGDQTKLSPVERTLVASAVQHFDGVRYELHGWVVMDDHVHVILTPSGYDLAPILKSWKSLTGRVMRRERGTEGSIWQKEYFDRIIRDDEEFEQKMAYVAGNPAKRWPEITNYPWVWVKEE